MGRYPKKNKDGELIFPGYPDFRPNIYPKDMLKSGILGGGYFRDIYSQVTKKHYKDTWKEFPKNWFTDLPKNYYASQIYDTNINKYKVHSGARLNVSDQFGLLYWESQDWIIPLDPYGWIMWYFRFYLGRRSYDDQRQIKRWLNFAGPNGRFRRRLINECKKKSKNWDDYSVSPVIRQGLLHWGYELTKKDFERKN